jgi:hypothetical protein
MICIFIMKLLSAQQEYDLYEKLVDGYLNMVLENGIYKKSDYEWNLDFKENGEMYLEITVVDKIFKNKKAVAEFFKDLFRSNQIGEMIENCMDVRFVYQLKSSWSDLSLKHIK